MLPLFLAAPTAAAAAAVPTGASVSVADLAAPNRLRSGIVVGLSAGAGLAGASGYPNDINRIGDRAYYSASGWLLGAQGSLFVMGALTDYLSFGAWYAHVSDVNGSWRAKGDGGGLRVEAFPLVGLVPSLAGLGIFGQFGVGTGRLTSKTPGLPDAQGTQSTIGVGVFHEWSLVHLLGGHLGAGPALEYDAMWSLPYERHGLIVGARLAFYGGP